MQRAPAPLWRREAASLVNDIPFLLAAVGLAARAVANRKPMEIPLPAAGALQGTTLLVTSWLVAEYGGTAGQRLLGLRVVDAVAGTNLSFQRALLRTVLRSAPDLFKLMSGRIGTDAKRRRKDLLDEKRAAVAARARELKKEFGADRERLQGAMIALQREEGLSCWTGCLDTHLIFTIAFNLTSLFLALRSPRRQTLPDLLSRAVVISAR